MSPLIILPETVAAHAVCELLEFPDEFARLLVEGVLAETVRRHHAGRLFPATAVLRDVLSAAGFAAASVTVQEKVPEIFALVTQMRTDCPVETEGLRIGGRAVPKADPIQDLGIIQRIVRSHGRCYALCDTTGWHDVRLIIPAG